MFSLNTESLSFQVVLEKYRLTGAKTKHFLMPGEMVELGKVFVASQFIIFVVFCFIYLAFILQSQLMGGNKQHITLYYHLSRYLLIGLALAEF